MGICDGGRLKGFPCAPLRSSSVNVTMPFSDRPGEYRTKTVSSETHCLVTGVDAALEQEILDLSKRKRIPNLHQHCRPHDLR